MKTDVNDLIVVCGARRLHRRPSRRRSRAAGSPPHPRGRYQTADRLVSAVSRSREPAAGPAAQGDCESALRDAAVVYNLAADMGGMGFIENNRALCMLSVLINTHLLMAAREFGVAALLLRVVGVRVCGRQAGIREHRAAQGSGRLSGDAGRRLRLGEAFQRAHVPAFPRGLRRADARGALPQCLRPARHVDGRPREGAGGDLPQGHRGQAVRPPRNRDLGRRGIRRAASCISTIASRARR